MRFPEIETRSLSGVERRLPRDLPAERTLLLLPFKQWQQRDVDAWIALAAADGLAPDLGTPAALRDVATIEVPCLGRRWTPARRFIDGGMAAGIGVPEILARTWTAYTDVDRVQAALGIHDSSQVWAFVLARDGEVRERSAGVPTDRSWAQIRSALTART